MELRYLLKSLLQPPAVQLLLLLFGWCIHRRFPRTARLCMVIALGTLWGLATPIASTYLARTLEHHVPLSVEQVDNIHADAIVVLSAAQREYAPEYGQPVSGQRQLCRLRYAAYLHRKTRLPILVSGGSLYGDERRTLAETMHFDLFSGFGVEARWKEQTSRTTGENARYSYRILAAEGKARFCW